MPAHWTERHLSPRRRLALGAACLLVLGGLGFAGYLWYYWQRHVSTDDAYVTAHISPVSARIPGTVTEVLVADNQDVKAGAALVRLDPKDYEVALALARAASETAQADLENALVNVPLTDETTGSLVRQAEAALAAAHDASEAAEHNVEERRSRLQAKQAAVAAAEAAVRVFQAQLQQARQDRDRMKQLVSEGAVAQQDFDHAQAAFEGAQASLEAIRQQVVQAQQDGLQAAAAVRTQTAGLAQARQRAQEAAAALANSRSQRQQVKARQAQVDAARSRLSQASANLRQAELNLQYTTIRAPAGGRVTKKAVEVGQVVQPGQPLLSTVDLDDVWVVGNYKETQLTRVRAGQPAAIVVDTYPGLVFRARVDSIQAGSGAVFSLLPPENATGNFVKVVQRVPVKLVFEPGENSRHLLVPGMSVVPTIAIR